VRWVGFLSRVGLIAVTVRGRLELGWSEVVECAVASNSDSHCTRPRRFVSVTLEVAATHAIYHTPSTTIWAGGRHRRTEPSRWPVVAWHLGQMSRSAH